MNLQLTAKQILHGGHVKAPTLVLDEPLSFWGGFDPVTGTILEPRHPQNGQTVTGKIVLMSHGKGSAGTPAGVAESIRRGSGPVGLILLKPDVNIVTGAMVAHALYQIKVPIFTVEIGTYAQIQTGLILEMTMSGSVVQCHIENP